MNPEEQVLKLAKSQGLITAKDIESIGISRNYLYKLCSEGKLTRSSRGIYMYPDMPITENHSLIEISKKNPNAVICLISALYYYKITTQIPHEIWVAIKKDTRKTKFDYPPVRYTVLSGKSYSYGITENNIDGHKVKFYSLAKTIADCFKLRNQIGIDIALEALKESIQSKQVTIDELTEAAKINRVLNIMLPYMEAIV